MGISEVGYNQTEQFELANEGEAIESPAKRVALGTAYAVAGVLSAQATFLCGALATMGIPMTYILGSKDNTSDFLSPRLTHASLMALTLPLFVAAEGVAIAGALKGFDLTKYCFNKTIDHLQIRDCLKF